MLLAGRALVLGELETAFPRPVAARQLLQRLPFETKAALNRLLYKMLDQKDIRRASVSPPTWTLFNTPGLLDFLFMYMKQLLETVTKLERNNDGWMLARPFTFTVLLCLSFLSGP